MALRAYRVFAFSITGYSLQLSAPDDMLLRAHRGALQRLLRGPWNAIPSSVLCGLRVLGFQVEVDDLAEVSLAARFKTAISSAAFRRVRLLYCDCIPDLELERTIAPRDRVLVAGCAGWCFEFRQAPCGATVAYSSALWTPAPDDIVDTVTANLNVINRAGLRRPALASLKAIAKAWPTSRRFQESSSRLHVSRVYTCEGPSAESAPFQIVSAFVCVCY